MKSVLFGSLFFSLTLSASVSAQTDSSQKVMKSSTGGSCSPIVNGGSSQITINCNGLSAAKAGQLVTLMNRILAERLDLSEVNTKLDQLQSALGDINDTMTNAMDPFAKAPPAMVALLKQGELLSTRCGTFVSDWSQMSQAASEQTLRDMTARRSSGGPTSGIDQQKGQEFASSYGAKLAAMNAKLHTLMPDAAPIQDIGVPSSAADATSYNMSIYVLLREYQKQQMQQGRPADARLLADGQRLSNDCMAYIRAWNDSRRAGLQAMRQPGAGSIGSKRQSAKEEADAQEVEKYKQKLEPQLVAFRDAVLPHVPDYASGKDYDAVGTTMQLNAVCGDVRTLWGAYRTQAATDLKQANAATKKR